MLTVKCPQVFSTSVNNGVVFGLSLHAQWGDVNDHTISIFIDSGARWVRTDWDTEYNMRSFVKLMKDNGVKVLGILDYFSVGFRDFTLSDWAETVEEAAGCLDVDAWEVWNEPNIEQTYLGYMDGSPEHYVEMLKVAHDIIKRNSNASVVFAGLSPYGEWGDWLSRCYDLGASNYSDVQGQHLYEDAQSNIEVLRETHRITGKKIWVTEIGRPSFFPYGEQKQAIYLEENFDKLSKYDWIEKIFWYCFLDYADSAGNDPEKHYGLVRSDYSFKPSWHSFKSRSEETEEVYVVYGTKTPRGHAGSPLDVEGARIIADKVGGTVIPDTEAEAYYATADELILVGGWEASYASEHYKVAFDVGVDPDAGLLVGEGVEVSGLYVIRALTIDGKRVTVVWGLSGYDTLNASRIYVANYAL